MFSKFLKEKFDRFRKTIKEKAGMKKAEMKDIDAEYSRRYKAEHPVDPAEKVLRESGGQDITAI